MQTMHWQLYKVKNVILLFIWNKHENFQSLYLRWHYDITPILINIRSKLHSYENHLIDLPC